MARATVMYTRSQSTVLLFVGSVMDITSGGGRAAVGRCPFPASMRLPEESKDGAFLRWQTARGEHKPMSKHSSLTEATRSACHTIPH